MCLSIYKHIHYLQLFFLAAGGEKENKIPIFEDILIETVAFQSEPEGVI